MATAKARKYRDLREARGLSADELGRRIGVDEATIRRWEGGEEEPAVAALPGLASALGVSPDELRHEEDRARHPGERGS